MSSGFARFRLTVAIASLASAMRFVIRRNRLIGGVPVDRLVSAGLDRSLADEFPFSQPVFFAFRHQMSSWCEVSLPWLPFISISEALGAALAEAAAGKWLSQHHRHELRTVIKRSAQPYGAGA